MSSVLKYFNHNGFPVALSLNIDFEEAIESWHNLRSTMIRNIPQEFSRDEWAYVINFVGKSNLITPFNEVFGELINSGSESIDLKYIIKAKDSAAIWLPNNVSLLGPLTIILMSLTGIKMTLKAGTRSRDLSSQFIAYVLKHMQAGNYRDYLSNSINVDFFDREDPKNKEMAKNADIRIVFGSDLSAEIIEKYDHPIHSSGTYFSDKQSEIWLEKIFIDKKTANIIIKIFAIYGQAGCTSPKRIIILDGDENDKTNLQLLLIEEWSKVIKHLPEKHIASSNILFHQLSLASGYNSKVTDNNQALFTTGTFDLPKIEGPMLLPILNGTMNETIDNLPHNIQTVGFAGESETYNKIISLLSQTSIERFVPISTMHHFSHIWDGMTFWENLFTRIELG